MNRLDTDQKKTDTALMQKGKQTMAEWILSDKDIGMDGAYYDYPELIRCKDCKHKHIKDNVWTCPFGLPAGCDFYCGYGERKEE